MRLGWLVAGFGQDGSEGLPLLKDALSGAIEAWTNAADEVGEKWQHFDKPVTDGPDESIDVTRPLLKQVMPDHSTSGPLAHQMSRQPTNLPT